MRNISILVALIAALVAAGAAVAGEPAPQAVIDLVDTDLVPLQTDPIIVAAVNQENGKRKSLDQIKELDQSWVSTPGIDDFMRSLLDSECGKHLQTIRSGKPYYSEIFVMDNQGANVAMTDKTSDYWQGDETKFTDSYRGGAGGIHISDVEFDESAQAYLVQVSLAILDGDRAIGAITVGIDIDELEQ